MAPKRVLDACSRLETAGLWHSDDATGETQGYDLCCVTGTEVDA